MAAAKPTILVILSGGGFTFETKTLLQALQHDAEFVYLATEYGGVPGEFGIPPGPHHRVPTFQTVSDRSTWQSIYAFFKTFIKAFGLLARQDIRSVVGVGCSHLVPMFLAGRLLGRNTVYIESITRVDQLSNTGKLVYRLRLSSLFVVQWPGLNRLHPKSALGTLL